VVSWFDGTREPVARRSATWGFDPVTEIYFKPAIEQQSAAGRDDRPDRE
jgi:hypothetical protein